MRQHVSSAVWIIGGTALTALGTLVGVRVLTQFLTPAVYGVVSLALGMSALAISLVSTPLTQAAIHYYPSVAARGAARDLLGSLQRCFLKMTPWLLGLALVGGCAFVIWGGGSLLLVVLIVSMLACDCWRSANVSLLNAARRNRHYALWVTADTWARPLVAAAAVLVVGRTPEIVLGAYVVTAAILIALFSRNIWPPEQPGASSTPEVSKALDARMWTYAIPLIPMGIVGWASNLGDRYVIGGILSVADAGLYAAIYGMSYAPFTLVGGTVELALRPVHQAAVASGDHARAHRLFRMWVATVAGIGVVGVIIYSFGHPLLAILFVGQNFRGGSELMPWIGAGYAIRATSYVFERVCYAYGQTKRVLTVQLIAVAATVIATPLGVLTSGLKGAAMAVPVYFSVQLLAAIFFAHRTMQEATATSSGVAEHAPA
jgi:O-antigen/teichoic acid export membrane protein